LSSLLSLWSSLWMASNFSWSLSTFFWPVFTSTWMASRCSRICSISVVWWYV
jgi:hypothetical protein